MNPNPDNEPTPPEAPPTGPVLSAEDEVLLLERAACTSHGAMKDAQAWSASHEALRATLTQRDARLRDLVGSVEYALNVLGTGACTANTCQGCHHEVNEAIESLRSGHDAAMKEPAK